MDTAGQVLSDHQEHPVSICRHEDENRSVAGLISVPEDGLLYAYRGNPCEGAVTEYSLEDR